jgi:hypothetical protein
MEQKINKKLELIIKVFYKDEEEVEKGIIPFGLISSSLFVLQSIKIFLNNLILLKKY